MKNKIYHLPRIIMGLTFFLVSINSFFHLFQMPEKGPEGQAFFQALEQAKYFWPLEKGLEFIFGIFLLIRRFVPLAIEGLAPIIINILCFHLFVDIHGIWLAAIVIFCEIILIIQHWGQLHHLFQAKLPSKNC